MIALFVLLSTWKGWRISEDSGQEGQIMLYYRFDIQFKNSVHSFRKKDSQEEDETKINLAVQGLNEKQDYNVCFFISDFSESGMTLCASIGSKNRKNAVDLARQFIIDLGLEAENIGCREITVSRLAHEAHSAHHSLFTASSIVTRLPSYLFNFSGSTTIFYSLFPSQR